MRRRVVFGEVINDNGVDVIGPLRIIDPRRTRAAVAVVHPEGRLGARLQVRKLHPDKSLIEQRVVFLDVIGEQRLLVVGDKTNVAAIFLRLGETEISIVQTNQNCCGPDRIGDGRAGRGGIELDLLANGPVLVPPGSGVRCRRDEKQNDRAKAEREEMSESTRFVCMFMGRQFGKSEIGPEPKGDVRVERVRLDQIQERQAQIERAVEVIQQTKASAESNAGQGKTRSLPRQRVVKREHAAIGENVSAPVVALALGPGGQLRCPQFKRTEDAVVADRFRLQITAHSGEAAAGELLRC